jgi:hypothetical protein
MRDL